ncbi:hypothetical protein ACFLYR_03610 [Chloroflexota bacterium]
MRDFNEANRKKKIARIRIQENPGNLSMDVLSQLEKTVKASLKDGYILCPVAWKIAEEANVPKVAIGEITDRLGIRITNCQIGCFKIEKTPYNNSGHKNIDGEIITMLKTLKENNQLTCAKVFDVARQFKLKPMVIANEANVRDLKIRSCQLGCF